LLFCFAAHDRRPEGPEKLARHGTFSC